MDSRGNRKQDHLQPGPGPNKRQRRLELEGKLEEVQEIMTSVNNRLCHDDNNEIIVFLRKLIQNLDVNKKEQVGVFGKTGAGKSSLINAVIGKDLLPTGLGRACTAVIIKVEGNSKNQKYEAEVEFITVEELQDLVESMKDFFMDKKKQPDEENKDSFEKMTALFADDWRNVPYETFKQSKQYIEMSKKIGDNKCLSQASASALRQDLKKYTQNVKDPSGPWYWPVVKCVTVKVPGCDLLRSVTLVDLPGTGDRNKTRNDMWKEMLSSCGTVWVVSDVKRPVSEREPWEILQRACSLLGNGGECRNIHFICNQSDRYQGEFSPEEVKNEVVQEFQNLSEVQNHFQENCFKVFIVSAKDGKMPPEENEISDLDEFLQSLNDPEEVVQRYVSDAFGILALMKGARSQNTDQKKTVHEIIRATKEEELQKVTNKMETVYESFEKSLTEGVKESKLHWETAVNEKIGPINSFPRLNHIIQNDGVQRTKTGQHVDLNTTLSLFLTNSIDRQFRETFPNTGKGGLYEAVGAFSLAPERLIEDHKDVELQLRFLKSEEEKLKVKLGKKICADKKQIYNSLTKRVKWKMFPGYVETYLTQGKGAVETMKQILKDHVRDSNIFDEAKDEMLKRLKKLMTSTKEDLNTHMDKVMNLSLLHDPVSSALPDISDQFSRVEEIYNKSQAVFTSEPLWEEPQWEEPQWEESQSKASKSTEQTVFNPEVSRDSQHLLYRFRCPSAGAFRCSSTGLVFVVTKGAELQYRIVQWESQMQLSGGIPAGPLYDIECPDGAVCELYLPHCEPESVDLSQSSLCVAHISDSVVSLMKPQRITKSHVVVSVSDLSKFGLVRMSLAMAANLLLGRTREQQTTHQTTHQTISILPISVSVQQGASQSSEAHGRGQVKQEREPSPDPRTAPH